MSMLTIFLYFLLLVILLILILWIDWKFKCKKTVKENNLNYHVAGYAILRGDENEKAVLIVDEKESTILIIDGLFGVNQEELVFGHRFKDDVTYMRGKISEICSFDVSEYNENDFLLYVHKNCDEKNVKTKYIIRNMAGYSFTKRTPKLIRTRMICKIGFTNDTHFLFCYKNTTKNELAIDSIKKFILSK